MADKSLIEKLNQTDNSKITKFVKVLNEINDSSARTRVINLLNSIEQDIYILDSLNTNVDKDRVDNNEILKNINSFLGTSGTSGTKEKIESIDINDKYKDNTDIEIINNFVTSLDNLYSILINLNQSKYSFINKINDLHSTLVKAEIDANKYKLKTIIKTIDKFFHVECFLDTKLRSELYTKRKSKFNKYISRLETDTKVDIDYFCKKYETMLEIEKYYYYIYNSSIISDYNNEIGKDNNVSFRAFIVSRIRLLDTVYNLLFEITHDSVLKTIKNIFFDLFKIDSTGQNHYISILSLEKHSSNQELLLFPVEKENKNKINITPLINFVKEIQIQIKNQKKTTESIEVKKVENEILRIIKDIFDTDHPNVPIQSHSSKEFGEEHESDLISLFENFKIKSYKKIMKQGGENNKEYSKYIDTACNNKFFEIRDFDSLFKQENNIRIDGGTDDNKILNFEYNIRCLKAELEKLNKSLIDESKSKSEKDTQSRFLNIFNFSKDFFRFFKNKNNLDINVEPQEPQEPQAGGENNNLNLQSITINNQVSTTEASGVQSELAKVPSLELEQASRAQALSALSEIKTTKATASPLLRSKTPSEEETDRKKQEEEAIKKAKEEAIQEVDKAIVSQIFKEEEIKIIIDFHLESIKSNLKENIEEDIKTIEKDIERDIETIETIEKDIEDTINEVITKIQEQQEQKQASQLETVKLLLEKFYSVTHKLKNICLKIISYFLKITTEYTNKIKTISIELKKQLEKTNNMKHGGENKFHKRLHEIDLEFANERRQLDKKDGDEGDKKVNALSNEDISVLKELDFKNINNLNISQLRKKIYQIKNKDFIVQTEITNQDIYIFIAVIYIIRVIALYIVMWFIEIEMFKDNESVIVGYIFIYLFCFGLIFAFVNISDGKMNDTKGLLYYFYNRVDSKNYTRFIIHIGLLGLILVIPFIIRVTDSEPSTYKNINDTKKRNLYKFITNLSSVIWIVLAIMAFLFK